MAENNDAERAVLAAADYEVRKAEFAGAPPPWEAREGDSIALGDFRRLPVGSDEREILLFQAVNELWNMLDHVLDHVCPEYGKPEEGATDATG